MPEQTTRQIVPQGNKGSLPAQRTQGTTDPGGVWHPVRRRECLTILLGTYAENGQCNPHGRRTALYSVHQPDCACASIPTDWYCGSKSHQEPLYRTGSFRVSETGCAINEGFFCSGIPVSCISFQSTCGIELLISAVKECTRAFKSNRYCGSER